MPPLSPDASASTRKSLRRELRARRRALSASQQKIAARELARRLASLPFLQKAKRIALYWPMDGEIDPRALRQLKHFSRHEFHLPVLQNFPGNTLRFARWQPSGKMQPNRFGIPEPRHSRPLPARRMDAILMPLTGFDAQGNRLGMGGGFYDRTLAFRQRRGQCRPTLIGIAHACQQVGELAAAAWDIPLDWVVTDRHRFRTR